MTRVLSEGSFDSATDDEAETIYDLPGTFEALAAEASPIYADYSAACPDIPSDSTINTSIRTPEGRAAFAYSPEFHGHSDQCNPSEPEPAPEPDLNNPRVYCEMADAPSCCFDDNVVCPYLED